MTEITELTIDELARQVGMTVRNVRAHQSRGLLPSPEIRGRTGYYGPEHAARLELIKDLQAEGFNLESIRRILERSGDTDAVLDFTRALGEAFAEEQPEIVDQEALLARWGEELTPENVRRIFKLGFARPVGEDKFEVLSPRMERAGEELARLGVPLSTNLAVTETLIRHCEAIANSYVRLFLDHVWRPFEEGDGPATGEGWDEVRDALDRLRPLASEVLMAVFGIVMSRAVDKALERELERLSSDRRPTRRKR